MSTKKAKPTATKPTVEQLTEVIEGMRERIQNLERPQDGCMAVQAPEPPAGELARKIARLNDSIQDQENRLAELSKRFVEEKDRHTKMLLDRAAKLRELDQLLAGSR